MANQVNLQDREVVQLRLSDVIGREVRIDSHYIPDKHRYWIGRLQADEYGSYWIENKNGEVHFSLPDVTFVTNPKGDLPNIYLKN